MFSSLQQILLEFDIPFPPAEVYSETGFSVSTFKQALRRRPAEQALEIVERIHGASSRKGQGLERTVYACELMRLESK